MCIIKIICCCNWFNLFSRRIKRRGERRRGEKKREISKDTEKVSGRMRKRGTGYKKRDKEREKEYRERNIKTERYVRKEW